MSRSSRFALPAVLPVLILFGCVLLSKPWGEVGFNDDWSYIWSARVLAQTGHIAYNGWGAMMLGWQLYLGALFIKLFGFSFGASRASVLVVALLTSWLMQRVLVRCGCGEWNASIATLTVSLSPVYLPLAFSFMSDIPAFFCLLLCFYCCLRAIQSPGDRTALGWLCVAALFNDVSGTVRQTVWLGALIMVPCTAWLMRKRPGALLAGAALWLSSLIFVAGCLHLYHRQPYTFTEPLRTGYPIPLMGDLHTLLTTMLCALPLLAAFPVKYRFKKESLRRLALFAGVLVVVLVRFALTKDPSIWLAPFSVDAVSPMGIDVPYALLGHRPVVFPAAVSYVLTAFFLAAGLITLVVAFGHNSSKPLQKSQFPVSDQALFLLLAPMTAIYLLLITTRQTIFDRYGIPVLFVLVVLLLRVYERKIAAGLPTWSVITLVIISLFSVASLHDLWAATRARLEAAQRVLATGTPRSQLSAGVEYDGWTELELAGSIANPRLTGGPLVVAPPHPCLSSYLGWMPRLHPDYVLSYEAIPCLPQSQFSAIAYKTWLAPRDRKIYILAVPK